MDDILGLALSPIVSYSAPASRPLASSANSSIQKSSAERIQLPITLDFHSDEGREEIRKWYHKQPTTQFTRAEHRKDITGRFRHEFIVVYLDNSTVCQFDRRAHEGMRRHALKDEGTISEDSAHVITLEDTESRAQLGESEVLFTIDLDRKQDLELILAICHGIQSHPKAKSYSLLCYNCYFFSWTLVMIIKHKDLQVACWDLGTLKKTIWEDFSCKLNSHIVYTWIGLLIQSWGPNLHNYMNRAFFSSVEYYIYRGVEKSLEDYKHRVLDRSMRSKVLFWTWSPSMLREEILEALWRGSQEGRKRYIVAKAHSSKLSASTYSGQEDLEGQDVPSDSRATPFSGADDIPLLLGWRTWRYVKAQMASSRIYKELASFSMIDQLKGETLRSDFSSLLNQKDRRRFQSEISAQEHVTKRMEDHFKQVESYGFGRVDKMIKQAEESITEIWASICNESQLSFLA